MELSPQSVSSTTFKIVKKGYDPDEVRAYLTQLAGAIEQTQSQASAMEARARAAVVRLQEIAQAPTPTPVVNTNVPDEAETISRTLLLAQRTADSTVAEANAEAASITEKADVEAKRTLAGANEQVARLIEDARSEARRAGETQRIQVESEVQALLARREFLLSDVDYLEQFVVAQRDRLRDVAGSITDIVDRVPGGLGDMRRPLVSAVGDSVPDSPSTSSAATVIDQSVEPLSPAADRGSDDVDASAGGEVVLDATMPYERIAAEDLPAADMSTDDVHADVRADESADANPSDDDSMVSDGDPTPPSGTAQFLFEDITQEVPATRPSPGDLNSGGERG